MNEIIETIHSFYDSCASWWSWNTLVDDDMIWPTLWINIPNPNNSITLTISRSLPQCTMQNTMNFYKTALCAEFYIMSCILRLVQIQNDHVQRKESSYYILHLWLYMVLFVYGFLRIMEMSDSKGIVDWW